MKLSDYLNNWSSIEMNWKQPWQSGNTSPRKLRLPLSCGIFILTNLLNAQTTLVPPVAPQVPHQETRHGATVTDNYFWLREKSNPEVTKYLCGRERLHHGHDKGHRTLCRQPL